MDNTQIQFILKISPIDQAMEDIFIVLNDAPDMILNIKKVQEENLIMILIEE
jgi:hypothetical protein